MRDEKEMAKLEEAISQSKRWMESAVSLTNGITFPTNNRNRVAISLFHLCLEHHMGIHTLVDHGVLGSAFALFRPQFESYLRGVWYGFCATDKDIASFLKDKEPPKVDILIRDIESKGAFRDGALRRIKSDVWRNLCGFTHGGSIQVKARNTQSDIAQSYKPKHIAGLMTSSVALSQLGCLGISAMINSEPHAKKVRDAYQAIYGPLRDS
ncbi:MAG: hypothetical protein K2W84_03855 [Burkholderiales bacterium]|nr:hypothetical protein [Burkholderiales bacterium]